MPEPILYRVGTGWDSHTFAGGRPLMLGGLTIPHDRGLAGHSDGDVLLHAVCDALLGALALGDIGTHFPPSDETWRNAASSLFVRHAVEQVARLGWAVANLDCTLIMERPRLDSYRQALQLSLAALLAVSSEQVSIKAKTPEGLPWTDIAIAQCSVLLCRRTPEPSSSPAGLRHLTPDT